MRFFLLTLFILTSACSSFFQENNKVTIEEPAELRRAKILMRESLFKDAESQLKKYLSSADDIGWHGDGYLTLGRLYETQKDYSKAEETYRQAMKHGNNYQSTVTAQSLHRLSWIYEAQKNHPQMLLVLLDLLKSPGLQDIYVIETETPARIANVYYVLGQWDKAKEWRSKVKIVPPQKGGDVTPYPSLLYKSLAALPTPIDETFERHMERLSMTQRDLLDIGEMGDQDISKQALNHLREDYENLYQHLSKTPPAPHPVELQQKEKVRLDKLSQLMDMLQVLKSYRRPQELIENTDENSQFFKSMAQQEKRIQRTIYSLKIGVQPSNRGKNPNEAPVKKAPPRMKGANE
ncbi:MAG: hypothetical protein K2Q26_13845 [Bdellovibrionales bacterium]|nr:hypothetical protein [Bdellovibrionales bacterium]